MALLCSSKSTHRRRYMIPKALRADSPLSFCWSPHTRLSSLILVSSIRPHLIYYCVNRGFPPVLVRNNPMFILVVLSYHLMAPRILIIDVRHVISYLRTRGGLFFKVLFDVWIKWFWITTTNSLCFSYDLSYHKYISFTSVTKCMDYMPLIKKG
jgi:hypothetical protein